MDKDLPLWCVEDFVAQRRKVREEGRGRLRYRFRRRLQCFHWADSYQAMNELGTAETYSPPCCAPANACKSKTVYPKLRLEGEQVERFLSGIGLSTDKVYESTIQWQVSCLDKDYKSLTLSVIGADEPVEAGEAEEEDDGESDQEKSDSPDMSVAVVMK